MEVLHIFDRQDLFHLYDLVMKQYSESTPEGIELILWGDLKIMMESSIEVTDQGDFWNDQQDWEIVTWRLYEACGVCILEFKDGTVIHMLVERKYPLSKELLQRMLDFGLEVEVESTAALDLIRVLNSPCFMVKSWLVQDQTVLGKDYSNLLIADSLLKTIWFINAPCYGNEALASPKANELTIPEQTATGKGISNPFMAVCVNLFISATTLNKNVEDIQKDNELEIWWEEFRTRGRGDRMDEPWWPKMHKREEHIESCTTIICVAYALLAAVNFTRCPFAVYMPNRPPQSRRLLPEPGTTYSDELETNPVKAFWKTETA
ncbi:probable linoleate 9S-lipoxygenase 5 [Tanacetum coccineum]